MTPAVRLGVSGNSRIYMQRFKKYQGMLANQGDMDIPASIQAGVAVDATPSLTLMADYKHIFYNAVGSIGNASTNLPAAPGTGANYLGGSNGPGFGWQDIDVFKFGLEWRDAIQGVTLRAGYSYNTSPIKSRDVMFNIMAPGVVKHHFTAGTKIEMTDSLDLELSGMYAPEEKVSGAEIAPGKANHGIEVSMHQWELTAGVVWKFGQQDEPMK